MRFLEIPRYHAVGILECLFHFAQGYAQRGDVGKWTDEQIADAIGWPAPDAARLIGCLIRARWLELHREHRLIIHDWEAHADQTVRRNQIVASQGFVKPDYGADGKSPMLAYASRTGESGTEIKQRPAGLKPDQMLANESHNSDVDSQPMPAPMPAPMPMPMPMPMPTPKPKPAAEAAAFVGWMKEGGFQVEWNRWKSHRKEIGHTLRPTTMKAQLKKMEAMGHDRAIAAIRHTIEMGWTGLREPEAARPGPSKHQDSPARVRAKPGKYDNLPMFGQRKGQSNVDG